MMDFPENNVGPGASGYLPPSLQAAVATDHDACIDPPPYKETLDDALPLEPAKSTATLNQRMGNRKTLPISREIAVQRDDILKLAKKHCFRRARFGRTSPIEETTPLEETKDKFKVGMIGDWQYTIRPFVCLGRLFIQVLATSTIHRVYTTWNLDKDLLTSEWLNQAPTCLCHCYEEPKRKLLQALEVMDSNTARRWSNKLNYSNRMQRRDHEYVQEGHDIYARFPTAGLLPYSWVEDQAVRTILCSTCRGATQIRARRTGKNRRDAYVEVERIVDAERALGITMGALI